MSMLLGRKSPRGGSSRVCWLGWVALGAVACAEARELPNDGAAELGEHSAALGDGELPDALSLSFELDGAPYRLSLERSTPPVTSDYRSFRVRQGQLVVAEASPDLDCLYRGRVEPASSGAGAGAEPAGFAAMNLCAAGLRGQSASGFMRAAGRFWSLTPDLADRDASNGLDHLALPLQRGDSPNAVPELSRTTTLLREFTAPRVSLAFREGTAAETKYIDLLVMHDAARADALGNLTEADGFLFVETMNALLENSGLEPRLRVTLRGQITFEQDPYALQFQDGEVNFESLLQNFLSWAAGEDLPAHDEHMLLSGLDFVGSTVGFAPLEVACSSDSNGFIVEAPRTGGGFPILSAVHEMGHTLGMNHDDGVNCPNSGFIMAAIGCGNCSGEVRFSSCSIEEFGQYLDGPAYAEGAFCADDVPSAVGIASCGDGVVSAGETCDCGARDCADIDPCCDGASCQLEDGAECSDYNDGCCQGCNIVPASESRVCRAAKSSCDSAETCSGASKDCPPDSFDEAGGECEDTRGNAGSCYLGDCRSRGSQCELLAEQTGFDIGVPGPNCNPGCGNVICGNGNGGCTIIQNTSVIDGVACADGQCFEGQCVSLIDQCLGDPLKTEPGTCGCGTPDTDSDGDGAPGCVDGCPEDGDKQAPGTCGCGSSDGDSDGDGAIDCDEECPNDAAKREAGACGCGTAETDTDADGTPDCNDRCPEDANSVSAGACGCGVAETDSDGDGAPDCDDACPNDSSRSEAPCAPGGSAVNAASAGSSDGDGGCSISASSMSSPRSSQPLLLLGFAALAFLTRAARPASRRRGVRRLSS